MHVLRRATAVAVTVAAITGSAVAVAPAAVSPTLVESSSRLGIESFAVAISPAGERSALAYAGAVRGSRRSKLKLRAKLGRGRRFTAGQQLEHLRRGTGDRADVRIDDVKVAVSPDGVAVAAWIVKTARRDFSRSVTRVRIATAQPGGRFGRPRTPLRTTAPSLSLNALVAGRDGLVVLSLLRDDAVEVLVGRGGRFGARQRIGTSTLYVTPPTLALAPTGAVIAAWSPTFGSAAQAAILPQRARRFLATHPISGPGLPASHARAVAGPGGAGVAWTSGSPFDAPSSPGSVRFARLRTDAAAFAAPVALADVSISGAPAVGIARPGVAGAWRHYGVRTEPGDSDFFVNSRVAASASWIAGPTPRRLSELPALALRPVVAALPDRVLIAWREAPVGLRATRRIRLAVAGPDGWLPTAGPQHGGPADVQTTPTTGIIDDERPSGGDLSIAAGSSGALLAWLSVTRTSDGEAIDRLRVASYRP